MRLLYKPLVFHKNSIYAVAYASGPFIRGPCSYTSLNPVSGSRIKVQFPDSPFATNLELQAMMLCIDAKG